MVSANPRGDPRIECVVREIEQRTARLHTSLTLLKQRIASDEAARRNEANELRRHVDVVLEKVAKLECQLGRAWRGCLANGTTIMRAGQALAAATDSRRRNGSAPR